MLLIALSKLVPFIFILAALMASLFSQFLKNETSENVFAFIFVSLCMAPLHFLLMLQQNEGLLRSKKSSFFALAFLVFFFLTGIYFSETSQINTKTLLTLLVVLYTSMVTVSLIFVPLSRQKSTYLLFPSLYSALVFFCFNSSKPLLSSIMTGGFLFLLKFLATQVTFKEKASHV